MTYDVNNMTECTERLCGLMSLCKIPIVSCIEDHEQKIIESHLFQRSGLRKLIYVVEGDPNVMDSAESIKTAYATLVYLLSMFFFLAL
jgi:hypothetical protein